MQFDRFYWGFGIEDTFIGDPYKPTGKNLDEYELTDHYRLWKQDFDQIAPLGLDAVRWGIPWYRIQPQRNQWDWSFPDQVIPYITEEKRLTLVLDLVHYGVPRWMKKAFVDPDYPAYVAEYTQHVIERYGKYLRFATPFNEPHTACDFCGRMGVWPPYLSGYEGYFAVLKGIVKGTQRQTQLLQKAGIACVQVECSGGSFATDPDLQELAEFERIQQFMFFDCLTGQVERLQNSFPIFARYGLSEKDLYSFKDERCAIDVMGINFYPQFSCKDLIRRPDGRLIHTDHLLWTDALEEKIRERYARYQCPMMITETSVRDDMDMKKRWLREASSTVYGLYMAGVPVYGFFWFPIIDMYDWEYRVQPGPKEAFKACFGFFDQERRPNECAGIYQSIVNEAKK